VVSGQRSVASSADSERSRRANPGKYTAPALSVDKTSAGGAVRGDLLRLRLDGAV